MEQMTLGEMVNALKQMDLSEKLIEYDFSGQQPGVWMGSWRGVYSQFAISHEPGEGADAEAFLQSLESCIGRTFYGWKGGEFLMDESTPVWVDNSGQSHSTRVVGVKDFGWRVVILTEFNPY